MSVISSERPFKKGDLVSLAAYRTHSTRLSPGLVVQILESTEASRLLSKWSLINDVTDAMLARVQVLHPTGELRAWRHSELVHYIEQID